MKLHLGCGKRNFGSEWIHIDGGDFPHIQSHSINPLPYNSDTVDLIYASHLIEYFDKTEIISVLNEWYRVLKTNGILRLAVPNFEIMALLYCDRVIELDQILGPLYGRMLMNDKYIYHKTAYDFNSLERLLHSVGFTQIKKYNWQNTEHSEFDDHSQAYIPHMDKTNGVLISLNVEATK